MEKKKNKKNDSCVRVQSSTRVILHPSGGWRGDSLSWDLRSQEGNLWHLRASRSQPGALDTGLREIREPQREPQSNHSGLQEGCRRAASRFPSIPSAWLKPGPLWPCATPGGVKKKSGVGKRLGGGGKNQSPQDHVGAAFQA